MSPSFSKLFLALVGSYFRHEKGRTLLTAVGIALGVAVLVAVDLANESAVASFRDNLRNVAGNADVTLRGNVDGLDPALVARFARDDRFRGVSPLISEYIRFTSDPSQRVMLLGVDLLRSTEAADEAVRDVEFALADDVSFSTLLIDDSVVLLSENFLSANGLSIGDEAEFFLPSGRHSFRVLASLAPNEFLDSFDQGIAVIDLGVADALLGRGGRLDRIDLLLTDRQRQNEALAELQSELGPLVLVETPAGGGARADQMLAAFRFNLRALGQISILVGAFLIYNAMSVAVVRRRPVIGTLRALGVRRWRIAAVFLVEGLLLGIVGTAVGLLLGIALAMALLDVVSDAISINFFAVQATQLALAPGLVAFAVTLGVGGALLAAVGPAWDAASTPPANTMRRGSEELKGNLARLLPVVGLLALAAALVLFQREPPPGIPYHGYLLSVLVVAFFVFWSRILLGFITGILRAPLRWLFRAEGLIATAQVKANSLRASVAVCGLATSVGMAVSVSVMIGSFRETVTTWMNQILVADLYVSVETAGRSSAGGLPISFAEAVRELDGIERVDVFRSRQMFLNGVQVNLGAGELRDSRFQNRVRDGRSVPEAFRAAALNDRVLVSEALAVKQRLRPGDVIPIPTPTRIFEATIEAVYFDYSSEQGFVLMDYALYQRLFEDDRIDSIAVFLLPGFDEATVSSAISALIGDDVDLASVGIRSNRNIREIALEAFDRTFAITTVLQVIAVAVAILGVTTTLLAQLIDRRAEIRTLRTLGATRRRLMVIVLCESLVICLSGLLPGVVLGLILSYILANVIMLQSFGWTIVYTIPPFVLMEIALIVLAGVLVASIIPAREALRKDTDGSQLYR